MKIITDVTHLYFSYQLLLSHVCEHVLNLEVSQKLTDRAVVAAVDDLTIVREM